MGRKEWNGAARAGQLTLRKGCGREVVLCPRVRSPRRVSQFQPVGGREACRKPIKARCRHLSSLVSGVRRLAILL